MACDVDPGMEMRASTQAGWYGAPAKLFCAPKSKVPKAPRWDYTAPWCALVGACTGGKIFTKKASPCQRSCAEPDPICIGEDLGEAVQPGCVCPPEKPLQYNGVCTTAGWCPQAHMTQCSHLHCRYDGSHVRVHHNGMEQMGEKHYCRHSADLYGGCHCLCYHDQLQPPAGVLANQGKTWYEKSIAQLESSIGIKSTKWGVKG
jgi:hypothetical protein